MFNEAIVFCKICRFLVCSIHFFAWHLRKKHFVQPGCANHQPTAPSVMSQPSQHLIVWQVDHQDFSLLVLVSKFSVSHGPWKPILVGGIPTPLYGVLFPISIYIQYIYIYTYIHIYIYICGKIKVMFQTTNQHQKLVTPNPSTPPCLSPETRCKAPSSLHPPWDRWDAARESVGRLGRSRRSPPPPPWKNAHPSQHGKWFMNGEEWWIPRYINWDI